MKLILNLIFLITIYLSVVSFFYIIIFLFIYNALLEHWKPFYLLKLLIFSSIQLGDVLFDCFEKQKKRNSVFWFL